MRGPARLRRRIATGGLAALWAVVGGAAGTVPAAAESGEPGQAATEAGTVTAAPDPLGSELLPTALLVFVSYHGNLRVPIHPTHVREEASRLLAARLEAAGHPVVTVPELEPMMRRLRLRSERDLGQVLLEELARDFGTEELVVARLVTYDDRILLMGRGLSTHGGWLRWAAVAEADADRDLWRDETTADDRLQRMVESAGIRLLAASEGEEPGEPTETLVPLPLSSYGMGREESNLVQVCLLRSLLAVGLWQVPDPALVVDGMQRRGFDPTLLTAASRRQLMEEFASPRLLVPRASAFPSGQAGGVGIVPLLDDDLDTAPAAERSRVPVYLALSLIDARTGNTLAGRGKYLKPDDATGIFGRVRAIPLARRYEDGTMLLVRSLLNGEGSS